ncbi:protein NETWORKED 3C [Cocos nucifera]|uniref:Protein NETWORKED 3C n=1 Tax=Cocos nucifera TaxID=13894 RepID=A0A8K0IXY0_COCNU|nr:protein NETWORKED 3C [Cocos nucifera]
MKVVVVDAGKEARMMVKKELPHSWLFDSRNSSRWSPWLSSTLSEKGWSQKVRNGSTEASSALSSDFLDSEDSEVNDPEQETEVGSKLREVPDKKSDHDVVKQMSEELERLEQENATLKAELAEKNEEKREVIRQLSLPLDILMDEKNLGSHFEFKKLTKKIISWKLFTGFSKPQTTIMAP